MAKRSRSVVPLDQRVQVSRAQADVPDVGKREVRIYRKPGELSIEMEESPAPSTTLRQAKVLIYKQKSPE